MFKEVTALQKKVDKFRKESRNLKIVRNSFIVMSIIFGVLLSYIYFLYLTKPTQVKTIIEDKTTDIENEIRTIINQSVVIGDIVIGGINVNVSNNNYNNIYNTIYGGGGGAQQFNHTWGYTISQFDNYTTEREVHKMMYYAKNETYFKVFGDWRKFYNFTVQFTITLNRTIDSSLFLNKTLGIWNYNTSTWDYTQFTIRNSVVKSYTYTNNAYINKTSTTSSNIRVNIRTSNTNHSYSFKYKTKIAPYFREYPVHYPKVKYYASETKNQTNHFIHERPAYVHYHFNEVSGNIAYDSSGNGRHATIVGSPTWTAGLIGNGLNFGAVNTQYLTIGNIPQWDLNKAFTVEIWVKSIASAVERTLFGKGTTTDGISLYAEADGDVGLRFLAVGNTNSLFETANTNIETSTWYHIVATYDGTRSFAGLNVYINNVVLALAASGNTITGTDTVLTNEISGTTLSPIPTLPIRECLIDEFVLYDYALTAAEVTYRYNGLVGREARYPDYHKEFTAIRGFTEDWDEMINFTTHVYFNPSTTITSKEYIDSGVQIYNFQMDLWENLEPKTLTTLYSNSFFKTSQDYLNKTQISGTSVKVRLRSSNGLTDYTYIQRIKVDGWFQNKTHYKKPYLVSYTQIFSSLNASKYKVILKEPIFHKYKDITFRFGRPFIFISYLVLSFDFVVNRTLYTDNFTENKMYIRNVTDRIWENGFDYDIYANKSIYLEFYPSVEYLTKNNINYCDFTFRILTSNVGHDYTLELQNIFIIGWNYQL